MKVNKSKMLEIDNQKVFFKSSENMKEVPSESVTLIVTSPPYWNVRDYGGDQIGFGQSYSEYIKSLNKVWRECLRVLQPNGKFAINVQPLPIESSRSGFGRRIIQNLMFDIEKFMRENNLFLSGMTNIASNTGFEHIFVWVKPGKTRKVDKLIQKKSLLNKNEWRHWAVRCIWDDIAPVFKIDSKGINRFGHSAPFPESIPYRLIRMHTLIGETVLDPFLGSGTTLKVCRLTSRKGIGYEINTEYLELIRNRILENWTFPSIQSQYKVFGTEEFYDIVNFMNKRMEEKATLTLKEIFRELNKKFPQKITKSWLRHLEKQIIEKNEIV
ncbi:MAG: DNA-methyltransferase [Candidatus Hodarchaeales archaeon]|jgi:DNA modification methylase